MSYGQFRGEKRNAVISLLDGDSKSTTPSELIKKMTGDIDDASFHAVNGKNFPTDRDIMYVISLEKLKNKKKKKDLGLTKKDTLQRRI